ncbi:branched-chain amino acid ABC transporter, ATP-binding protein, partial [mine drainage metagenome]
MTEQGVFPNLSIKENLEVGGYSLGRAAAQRRITEVYTLFPDLAARPRELAGSLSGGQRKMLAVAKALVAGPELLVMDEPSSGLSPRYVAEVVSIL